MKAVKYIAIGLGTVLTLRYLFSLNRAKNNININVSGQKDSITTQGVTFLLKYNIQNPTSARMKVTPPLIRLLVDGKLLASSEMQSVEIPQAVRDDSGKIKINAFSETGIITTKVLIPWLNIVAISPTLLTRFQDPNDKIKIAVQTLAHVFTLVGDYPYEYKAVFSL